MLWKSARKKKQFVEQKPMRPDPFEPETDVAGHFRWHIATHKPKAVLEVGTRRTDPSRKTHRRDAFPWVSDADYLRLDIRDGLDVDVIGDIHALPSEWSGRFECFIADAVFEHLERPWIAAKEVARILAPGGCFFIVTHQCYPLHGHPSDFFRFSKEALRLIFEDAGLSVTSADYGLRCMIVPPESVVPTEILETWNREYPSFAHVKAFGVKP